MLKALLLRIRCTLKNTRWSKFLEPFTTASLIILWNEGPSALVVELAARTQNNDIIKRHAVVQSTGNFDHLVFFNVH